MKTNEEVDLRTNESDQWSSQSTPDPVTRTIVPRAGYRNTILGNVHSIAWVKTGKGGHIKVVGTRLRITSVKES